MMRLSVVEGGEEGVLVGDEGGCALLGSADREAAVWLEELEELGWEGEGLYEEVCGTVLLLLA
jgi:hypothetical protein